MIQQFFFGTTDSPLHMFQHALGSVLLLIFFLLILAAFINWIRRSRKNKNPITAKVVQEKKIEPIAEKPKEKKEIAETDSENNVNDSEDEVPYGKIFPTQKTEANKIIPVEMDEGNVHADSVCNTDEHIFLFTEILLNKRLSEQDWDKRIPENVLLDHRSYHQLIFLLVYLNPDTTQTTSRFKMVLETSYEVAINQQIYFRNWMMPVEMLSVFKIDLPPKDSIDKNIRAAVKIAELKNWKLTASTSEQGTMINLLMKCELPK